MATNQGEITLDCMKKTLTRSLKLLGDNLRPDNMLRTLQTESALTPNDVTKIKHMHTDTDKVDELLGILAKSPVSSYIVFMRALQEERADLYKRVKAIEEQESGVAGGKAVSTVKPVPIENPGSGAQKVSKQDIRTITSKADLTKDQLDALFDELGISDADVENGRSVANTNDFKLQSSKILHGWLQKKGRAATRQAVLNALSGNEEIGAVQQLKQVWGITP